MRTNTILFSMDPEGTCLIVHEDMPEEELQSVREQFPKHKIVSACSKHAPIEGVFMASSLALLNLPPCAILLTPDDGWIIPPKA